MQQDFITKLLKLDPQAAKDFFDKRVAYTIGPEELLQEIKRSSTNINIIDVRKIKDFDKSHIPRAINLPEERWETMSGLEKNKLNIIYSYSQTCHLAPRAALMFANAGYHVMELEGGFQAWEEYSHELETV